MVPPYGYYSRKTELISTPASRHNLIRAENGAIRFVPRIEKRPWTRSRVVLWSAKVLFRRGSRHMRRTYIRMGEKLARIRQPDHNDDAARRFDPTFHPCLYKYAA